MLINIKSIKDEKELDSIINSLSKEHDNTREKMLEMLEKYYNLTPDDCEYFTKIALEYERTGCKLHHLKKYSNNAERWLMVKVFTGTEDENNYLIYSSINDIKDTIKQYNSGMGKETGMYLEEYLRLHHHCIECYEEEKLKQYGLTYDFDFTNHSKYDLTF